jgi:hypothetical protein
VHLAELLAAHLPGAGEPARTAAGRAPGGAGPGG